MTAKTIDSLAFAGLVASTIGIEVWQLAVYAIGFMWLLRAAS